MGTRVCLGETPGRQSSAPDLMARMRHESIETTLRYYVGRNAQRTAKALWDAYRQKGQSGNTSGNRGFQASLPSSFQDDVSEI